jgi:hypothetical protein
MRQVLNVGGGNKSIALPPQYEGWEQLLLDIDPSGGPDIILDAREMTSLTRSEYDSVYCSHNLEHYYFHDAKKVLDGFHHVLKEDGFAHIRVPDMTELMQTVISKKLEIDDVLYQSALGPITVHDVIYGYGVQLEKSGNDFYAHKMGFTEKSLIKALQQSGFNSIYSGVGNLEINAFAFKSPPTQYAKDLLKLP